MPSDIEIRPVKLPLEALDDLVVEARAEGFGFLDRLVEEWNSGVNRFSRAGEILYGAFDADKLVAVGGLNCDPYQTDDDIGRLRRFYVVPSYRRTGVGSAMVARVLAAASGKFFKVRLLTNNLEAWSFYESCGFQSVDSNHVTHEIHLPQLALDV